MAGEGARVPSIKRLIPDLIDFFGKAPLSDLSFSTGLFNRKNKFVQGLKCFALYSHSPPKNGTSASR
jgi:hypothetical protein